MKTKTPSNEVLVPFGLNSRTNIYATFLYVGRVEMAHILRPLNNLEMYHQ